MKNLIYLALAAVGGYALYTWIQNKKSLISQLSVGINNASLKPGFASTEIDFNITITNPSKGSENVQSLTASVLYNNTPIGTINYLQPFSINALSTKALTIPLIVSNIDVIKNFPTLLSSSFAGIKVNLKGYINTDLGTFPIDQSTTIL